MATHQRPPSPESDGDPRYAKYDEKKRKRMMSNRESARRSRMKKQQQMEKLIDEISQLENQKSLYIENTDITTQAYNALSSENSILRAQLAELTDHLRSLSTVAEIVAIANGIPVEIPEIPDSILEPWQLPCPMQLVTTLTNLSQY